MKYVGMIAIVLLMAVMAAGCVTTNLYKLNDGITDEGFHLTHTVLEGETLDEIAELYYGNPDFAAFILEQNGIRDTVKYHGGTYVSGGKVYVVEEMDADPLAHGLKTVKILFNDEVDEDPSETAERLAERGNDLLDDGDLKTAAYFFQAAIEFDKTIRIPRLKELKAHSRKLYKTVRNYTRIRDRKVKKPPPDRPRFIPLTTEQLLTRAEKTLSSGKIKLARQRFDKINHPTARAKIVEMNAKSKQLFDQGKVARRGAEGSAPDLKKAETLFQKAYWYNPNNADALSGLSAVRELLK